MTYGDYEVISELAASRTTLIYLARRKGRDYVVKVFRACMYAEEERTRHFDLRALEADLGAVFLQRAKLQKDTAEKCRRYFAPIHDANRTEEGAWYATDHYPRRSLKHRLGQAVDVDNLRRLIWTVLQGLLEMRRVAGRSHGNLKPANILLGGSSGTPLGRSPLFLMDPQAGGPADAEMLELADLRALGELMYQLVTGHEITGPDEYNYPIEATDAWRKLGEGWEAWLGLCNRLVFPRLTLKEVNLERLAQEIKPSRSVFNLGDVLRELGARFQGLKVPSWAWKTAAAAVGITLLFCFLRFAPSALLPGFLANVAGRLGNSAASSAVASNLLNQAKATETRGELEKALELFEKARQHPASAAEATARIQSLQTRLEELRRNYAAALNEATKARALSDQYFKARSYVQASNESARGLEQCRLAWEAKRGEEVTSLSNALLSRLVEIRVLSSNDVAFRKAREESAKTDEVLGDYARALVTYSNLSQQYPESASYRSNFARLKTWLQGCVEAKQRAMAAEPGQDWIQVSNLWANAQSQCGAADKGVNEGLAFVKAMLGVKSLLDQARERTVSAPAETTNLCDQALAALPQPSLWENQGSRPKAVAQVRQTVVALKETAAGEDQFTRTLAAARAAEGAKDYAKAQSLYEAALKLKPGHAECTAKVAEMKQAGAAAAAAAEQQFNQALAAARTAERAKDYAQAQGFYEEGLRLKPGHAERTAKVAEMKKGGAAAAAAAAAARAMEEQFAQALAAARAAEAAKDFAKAQGLYEEGLRLKPGHAECTAKVTEMKQAVAAAAAEEQFSRTVAAARAAEGAKDYVRAQGLYEAALKLKPGHTECTTKVAEMKQAAALAALVAATEQEFNRTLTDARAAEVAKDYAKAQGLYEKGLSLKPGHEECTTKVAEMKQVLAALAAAKATEEQFARTVAAARAAEAAKDFAKAQGLYEEALRLKPGHVECTAKVAEMKKELAALAAAKLAEEQFAQALAAARAAETAKDFAKAQGLYEEALKVKPGDQECMTKVEAMKRAAAALVVEQQFAQTLAAARAAERDKDYAQAQGFYEEGLRLKPGHAECTAKVAEMKQALAALAAAKTVEEQFARTLAAARAAEAAKDFTKAQGLYEEALRLKPGHVECTAKVAEMKKELAALAAAKLAEEQFARTLAAARAAESDKDFAKAQNLYEEALRLKPGHVDCTAKVAEMKKELAALAAAKAVEEQFAKTVAAARAAEAAKDFAKAQGLYEEALRLKPGQAECMTKVAEMKQALAALVATEREVTRIVTEARAAEGTRDYAAAQGGYEAALKLKPGQAEYVAKAANLTRLVRALAFTNAVAQGWGKDDWKAVRQASEEGMGNWRAVSDPALQSANASLPKVLGNYLDAATAMTDAEAQKQKGQYAKAKETFRAATNLFPGDSRLKQWLDRLVEEEKQSEQAKSWTNPIGMTFRWVPNTASGGTMADKTNLGKGFYAGVYEVSQAEYQRIMGVNPSKFPKQGDEAGQYPVENVTWAEAAEFCRRLTATPEPARPTGWVYRLPRDFPEQRAFLGEELTTNTSPATRQKYGVCGGLTSPANRRTKEPNEFGLYNVVGNVKEWIQTSDPEAGDKNGYVFGPSYAYDLKVAQPSQTAVAKAKPDVGFRVLLAPP
jgi:tetratricopeptide (TPR) repeat protein